MLAQSRGTARACGARGCRLRWCMIGADQFQSGLRTTKSHLLHLANMRVLRNTGVFHAIGRWHRTIVLLALASLLSLGYNLPWFSTKEMFIALSVHSAILIFDFITTPWTQSLFGIDAMPDFPTCLSTALMKEISALCIVCLPLWIAMYSTPLLCSTISISSRLPNGVFGTCTQLFQDCRINWILDGTNFAVLYRPEVHPSR